MAAGSPGRTFSTLRALGALAVIVLLFVGIAFFGFVVTDALDDDSGDNGGGTETQGGDGSPGSVLPDDDGDENATDPGQSNETG